MKKKILYQFDHDDHASSFDSVVAIDSGVEQLLTFPNTTPIQIESLIHGGIFTRGQKDLHHTAAFFGGSNVEKTTELFEQAQKCFFGPLKISMMSDPNGSNTTAAAAVLCAQQHIDLAGKKVFVLAATGPVGQRICRICAKAGAEVFACSRSLSRAREVCTVIENETQCKLVPVEAGVQLVAAKATQQADVVFAAGAAGVEMLDAAWLEQNNQTKLALDINAVPPVGIAGIEVMDRGENRHNKICYGAIGIGELKMKIHKACIARLFESNDQLLDTDKIFEIGLQITSSV